MITHEKLLPCPFCGGEASGDSTVKYNDDTVKEQGWDQTTFYYCNCVRCGVSNIGLVGHRTREEAIAAWNRRTPPAAAPDSLPALPDDDSDFTPELARKIIAKYQEYIRRLAAPAEASDE